MADRITQFRDALGAADSFLHAMEALIETAFDGGNVKAKDYCALHLLVDHVREQINDAQRVVDTMEGETC